MELQKYYQIVEHALQIIGLNPEECRKEVEGQWNLQTGELEVWIDIIVPSVEESDAVYFQVMTPFAQAPENGEKRNQLITDLLSINYQMVDASFVMYEQGIYLRIMTDAAELTETRCITSLNRIGFYGTQFLEQLRSEYELKKVELEEDEH